MENIIKIKTLKDIVEKVPTETLNYFLEDLKLWVLFHQGINASKKDKRVSSIVKILNDDETMKWIDNSDTGKHEHNINIKIIN